MISNNSMNLVYLYLLSPLHTGGTTQEGNLLGIARESHTNLPYIPSSSIRGRLRASLNDDWDRLKLFGVDLDDLKKDDSNLEKQQRREILHQRYKAEKNKDLNQLEQGAIWIGDGSILWVPVPSLSHGVVWISCPLLLQRWARLNQVEAPVPNVSEKCAVHPDLAKGKPIYLKDAVLKSDKLQSWDSWKIFVPQSTHTSSITRAIVLSDQNCATLIQMSLWRQVKIKLDEHKTVDGGFRYEEAIPPDTLMYFPWGVTAQAKDKARDFKVNFEMLLEDESRSLLQIGGQESLGRGFVQQWMN